MFLSFAFTDTEKRYHTTEREALALLKALLEVRWLVVGSPHPVQVYTDHSALLKVLTGTDSHGRLARWQVKFSEYWLNVKHVPGKTLVIADRLSRIYLKKQYRPLDDVEEEFSMLDLTPDDPQDLKRAEQIRNSHSNAPRTGVLMGAVVAAAEAGDATVRDTTLKTVEDLEGELGPGWSKYMDDEWYGPILTLKKLGRVDPEGVLPESEMRLVKRAAKRIVLVERDTEDPPRENVLAYRERNRALAKCILRSDVREWLYRLHNIHGH
ncbi:hypothetical protein ABEF95_015655 [Exophiala dermatitidis]